MASVNKVILIGNLTADPELRYTPKGSAVANFNIAMNRKWKDDAGQQKDEVTFLGITAWGKQAETISQYLKKGRPIYIEGRLCQENYEKDGQKRSKTFVTLESFQFLDSGGTREGAQSAPPNASREPKTAGVPTRPSGPASNAAPAEEDQDIPFMIVPRDNLTAAILGHRHNRMI